ncbi:MAG: hypothetical protein JNK00_00525 [Flavipsychrobacter sp.]|nr:hypothetical protein [Flavipsychrobacter sp.]
MLRHQNHTHSIVGNAALTAPANHAVSVLLSFIEKRISGFSNYYFGSQISERENFISMHLANYFNSWLSDDSEGYIPYKFSFIKNPSQEMSTKESDIGVVILNPSRPSQTIFEFEAKRLSDTSNNSEYVYGERGGIERFKRNFHAGHLGSSGMFGYIQAKTAAHWVEKINGWITKCAAENEDVKINWKSSDEKLSAIQLVENTGRCTSNNLRINGHPISLIHYFIDLVPG